MRAFILVCLFAFLAPAADLRVESLRTAKGFTWVQRDSPHFDFYAEAGSYADRNLDAAIRIMEEARAHVEDLLGVQSPRRDAVFLVDSRARMKSLTGWETNGLSNGAAIFAIYSDTLSALGAHEICHNLSRALWGPAKHQWISEGLAVYADDHWQGQPLHGVARWLLDRNKLVPLSKLMKDGWQKKYSDMVTYPQLGSFVKFLYETHGRDAVKTIWERGAKNIEELEILWRAKLATTDASGIAYRP